MSGSIACVACHVLVHSFSSVTNSQICSLRQRQSTAPAASFLQALHVSRAIFTPPLISSTPSSPDDACRCCPVIFWCTNSIAKQVTLHAHPLNPDIHVPRHTTHPTSRVTIRLGGPHAASADAGRRHAAHGAVQVRERYAPSPSACAVFLVLNLLASTGTNAGVRHR
jgi:hypothetical protein